MPIDQQPNSAQLFKKQSGMMWARTFFLIGLASTLVFVLPVTWFPFQLGKVAIFALFLLFSLLSFSLASGWKTFWRASGARLALIVGALPLVYLLSAYLASSLPFSFLGRSVEVDTVAFVTLSFFAFILAFILFRTPRSVWLLLSVILYSLLAAAVFQVVSVVTGGDALFSIFTDPTANLVGKWNDFAVAMGLLLLLAITRLEFATLTKIQVLLMSVVAISTLFLLALINFSFAWGILIVTLVILVLVKLLYAPLVPQEGVVLSWKHHVPWFGLGSAAVLVTLLFFGAAINTQLSRVFPVSALEVRPSFEATLDVVSAGGEGSVKNLFLGTGPATFGQSWLMYKPETVNQSMFWDLDFVVGFSTMATSLASVGVVGFIAWMLAPLLVVFALLRAFKSSLFKSRERALAMMLAAGSIFLACTYIFYIPSQNLLLLTFTVMGSSFGFLWRSAQKERDMEEIESSRFATIARAVFALVCIVVVFVSAVLVVRRALSESVMLRGQGDLSVGQTDAALLAAQQAAWFESTTNTSLLRLAAGFAKLQQIASDTSLPTAIAQERFTTALTKAVASGREAMVLDPTDYRPYLLLGNMYSFLASLKVEGAYASARDAYKDAALRNPTSPQIPLAVARLETIVGDRTAAESAIRQALTLKPDYTDAILFVVQLEVDKKDLPNAIRAAVAAVQSAPGVPSIWFQLGLLYYTNKEMSNAIVALEKALEITPDYANAQYFLGLAYYSQKRAPEAIKLFEALQKANPENTEVQLILSNMRFGKDPFSGAQPPITDNPETRTTAPVEE